MSYANLVNQACAAGGQEIFQRMRDFICKRNGTYDYSLTGIGWTLYDSSYATDEDNLTSGDWIVLYSAGEGGNDDMYVKIDYTGDASPKCYNYLYWNNTTHAGVTMYGYNLAVMWGFIASDTIALWIYGDLDCVSIIPEYSSESLHYGACFGRTVDGPYEQSILTLTSGYSAGSAVDITLPSTPSYGYEAGKNIYIRDDAHIEIIQIDAIASNIITVDLVNSYASGAKVQADHCYFANSGSNFSYLNGTGHNALIARDGGVGGSSRTLGLIRVTTGNFEDSLQDLISPGIGDFVLGDFDGYYGWAGRLPNIYASLYSSDLTHNALYTVNGVHHRYKGLRYAVGALFKEV